MKTITIQKVVRSVICNNRHPLIENQQIYFTYNFQYLRIFQWSKKRAYKEWENFEPLMGGPMYKP